MKLKDLSYIIMAVAITSLIITGMVFPVFLSEHKLEKFILIALLSIFVIMKSASNIIYALSHYARETGISEYVVGFLVLSIGTSIPELTTGVIASLTNKGNLVLGNVLGANIIDITVILGVTAIIGRHTIIHGKVLEKTQLGVIGITFLPLVLGVDGTLSKIDGCLLVAAFAAYVYMLYFKEGKFGKIKNDVKLDRIWKDMVIFIGSLVALLLSAKWLILSSVETAKMLDIPLFIFGLFIISIGTTSPELTIAVKSILQKGKMVDLAFGDILGAVVTNSALVLGVSSIIAPINFSVKTFILPALFMVMSVFIGVLFIKKKEISWQEGIGLLLIYLTFVVSQILISS